MPPKPDPKAAQAKKVEDKTFGMKNKKGAQKQKQIQQMKGGGAGSADDFAKEASRPASHSGCRGASLWLCRSTGAPAVLRC